jgi:hypothetical protein
MSSIASYTSFSLLGSRADVASSNISIFGFLTNALAIAILYFYPPDRFRTLADPIYVSIPFSISCTNLAFALLNAISISSLEASLFPRSKLSLTVPIMRTGSYDTYPIDSLKDFKLMSLIFMLSR